jgi:hypothetical protein
MFESFSNSVWDLVLVVKCKDKFVLVLSSATCHEDVLGEWSYNSTHSLIPALDGGEW